MITKYFLFISGLILVACGSRDNTQNVPESDAVDTVSKESSNYERLSPGSWFTAKCELLCDVEHGKFLDIEKLKRYGPYNPYDIKQKDKQDSVLFAFDVIADCCMDFSGDVQIRNDTLVLEYQPANDSSGCDCSCDYRMIYRINRKNKNWVGLKTEYKRLF